MDMITAAARIVGEAVTKALIKLEAASDKLEYEVVNKGSTGFLGIGAKPAIICTEKKESTGDKAMDFLSQISEAMNMQMDITTAYNQEGQELSLNLKGEDMGVFVDKRGQILDPLQYLVSLIVNKGAEECLRVKLDTENYRERRKETLETLTKNIAYKIKRTKKPTPLELMNFYERRIVHAALQNDGYVTIRSKGEEPFRHMVVALRKKVASGDRKGRCDRNRGGRYERSDRSGGYRNNRRINENNASQISSDASTETAAGEEE